MDAEKYYDDDEQLYYSKKYEEAIDSFRSVYKKFPVSSFAPKSVFYIGMIYEKDLMMYDSAAAAYGILTKDFSNSKLASSVVAKYTEYKNEKDRIKREEETKQKELEAKQKEKEVKPAETIKTDTEEQQPQIQKQKVETINDDELIKRAAMKDSTFKKDTTKARVPIRSSSDSLKTKNDTTKVKPVQIVD